MIRESEYYIWLSELVGNRGAHSKLIKHLDTMAYMWVMVLDSNRASGGKNLRTRYAYETSIDEEDVRNGPCTVLEMLISVADHMVDQLDADISYWFWVLMNNLGLDEYTDDNYDTKEVEMIVNKWLQHDYMPNGFGSIFPLKHFSGDCRYLDVWSQMNEWIKENYPEDGSWLNY